MLTEIDSIACDFLQSLRNFYGQFFTEHLGMIEALLTKENCYTKG